MPQKTSHVIKLLKKNVSAGGQKTTDKSPQYRVPLVRTVVLLNSATVEPGREEHTDFNIKCKHNTTNIYINDVS